MPCRSARRRLTPRDLAELDSSVAALRRRAAGDTALLGEESVPVPSFVSSVCFSRQVKCLFGGGDDSLYPYHDRSLLRSGKNVNGGMRHQIGLGVLCVPRPDVTDGAGGQVEPGSSNLLPRMYRPRATVKLATSEI